MKRSCPAKGAFKNYVNKFLVFLDNFRITARQNELSNSVDIKPISKCCNV